MSASAVSAREVDVPPWWHVAHRAWVDAGQGLRFAPVGWWLGWLASRSAGWSGLAALAAVLATAAVRRLRRDGPSRTQSEVAHALFVGRPVRGGSVALVDTEARRRQAAARRDRWGAAVLVVVLAGVWAATLARSTPGRVLPPLVTVSVIVVVALAAQWRSHRDARRWLTAPVG